MNEQVKKDGQDYFLIGDSEPDENGNKEEMMI
jgi:hypothetical protein